MRHIDGIWNVMWFFLFIETISMRFGNCNYGIIGNTIRPNPEALKSWGLSLDVCGQIPADVAEMRDGESVIR